MQKYHQAAIAYLIYGLIYLGGAVYIAGAGLSRRSGLIYFIIGGLFVAIFPVLIWRGYVWFTRFLAIFMFYRLYELGKIVLRDSDKMVPLPWGGEVSMQAGAAVFWMVAAAACFMLARAGFSREGSPHP